jgi:outer membrane protein OmpA-like peptidoglycan-associated protein
MHLRSALIGLIAVTAYAYAADMDGLPGVLKTSGGQTLNQGELRVQYVGTFENDNDVLIGGRILDLRSGELVNPKYFATAHRASIAWGPTDWWSIGLSAPFFTEYVRGFNTDFTIGDARAVSRFRYKSTPEWIKPSAQITVVGPTATYDDRFVPSELEYAPVDGLFQVTRKGTQQASGTRRFDLGLMASVTLVMDSLVKYPLQLHLSSFNRKTAFIKDDELFYDVWGYGVGLESRVHQRVNLFAEWYQEDRWESSAPKGADLRQLNTGLTLKLPYNLDLTAAASFGFDNDNGHVLRYDSVAVFEARPTADYAGFFGVRWTTNFGLRDADRDGVVDRDDKCPATAIRRDINAQGCFVDSDADGVNDYDDRCFDTPKGVKVDGRGCPTDEDQDGIADHLDKCPKTPLGTVVSTQGCALDSDADGVTDVQDKCPGSPAGAPVDAQGCVLDADADGVHNQADKCPNTPKGVLVAINGCPVDTDADGVVDAKDQCANTIAGVQVDGKGCPVKVEQDLTKLQARIQYDKGSAKLSRTSLRTLDQLTKLMIDFKAVKLEIQGHTDNTGDEVKNQKLSEERAQAVVAYLTSKGVSAERLRAVGYGSSRPVADNDSDAERMQNRRTEIVQFQ